MSFEQWRERARELLKLGVCPAEACWADGQARLFEVSPSQGRAINAPKAPREFLLLAEKAACYRHPARWALLYRIIWRLNTGEPNLLEIASDPDVLKLRGMASAVDRDVHKMHAFVRFRQTEEGAYVAWYEPAHLVVELACPFFARRFDTMRWSILTPDRCAFWDGRNLTYGPGLSQARTPTPDSVEELWKTYYANIFNPARVKLRAMTSEMPKRHWKTMPETALIPEMLAQAEARVESMLAHSRAGDPEVSPAQAASELVESGGTLAELSGLARGCQACELYQKATQTVFGEGPSSARVMLVGEQPGDQEDRKGRPFIGPAGQLLRRTLAAAGLDEEEIYFTNTVKHFRWEPSPSGGKRRLHQRATARQIQVCQGWLEGEIRLLQPRVLVCLGATAAQSLLGPGFRLGRDRGRWLDSPLAPRVMATVHPSFLLRLSDPDEQERQKGRFLRDLQLAREALE